MSINWVMLNGRGFVSLSNERVLVKHESRISCSLTVPQELRAQCTPFSRKSDRGTLFLTNKRVIYLPERPTQEPRFESFSAPIMKLNDSTTSSSMFWGWIWKSDCVPVSGGGIPPDIPRIEVKLTFSDGGMMEFNETYIRLRERLFQWAEISSELGAGSASSDIPDEQLPAYTGPSEEDSENEGDGEEQQDAPPPPAAPAAPAANPSTAPAPAAAASTASAPSASTAAAAAAAPEEAPPVQGPDSSANRPAPNEPPPNYDEAQAQQISIRLEDHIRDEAERGGSRN